jgi:hypothetical protein
MTRSGFRLLNAAVLAAVLIFVATGAAPAMAQRADSNIGLEGGHDGLVDAILATPNRKTPVPQDNMFATAPGATQAAPTSQSKRKVPPTPPVINRTSRGEHR